MKRCPKCGTLYGKFGGTSARYEYCPFDGTFLDAVYRKNPIEDRLDATAEMNRWDYAVPWNEDIKVKGAGDERF